MKKLAAIMIIALAGMPLLAQQEGQAAPGGQPAEAQRGERRERFRGMGVGGTITAINGDTLTIKTMRGDDATVKTTSDTRFMKDQKEARLADFKTGDQVMIAGERGSDGVWNARFVGVGMMRGGGGGMMMGGPGGMSPEDLGKKFIVGKIKAIDGLKITVDRPDGQTQTIEVDENTSFRKNRESVTLADFKVGDDVMGRGELKNGAFVPSVLSAGNFMMRMGAGAGAGAATGAGAGNGQAPPPAQPK
ncbi:MAG TPA: DUF5666 domain-containing protein [Terriglobales bacterium]|nr:DUF5666 domain-containing protein [Terriglobales bacterium]